MPLLVLPPPLIIHRSESIKAAMRRPLRDLAMTDGEGKKLTRKDVIDKLKALEAEGWERIQTDPKCVTHDKVKGCCGCPSERHQKNDCREALK